MTEGRSAREAAQLLGLNRKIVETHRAARRKLDALTSASLVRHAMRNRLGEP